MVNKQLKYHTYKTNNTIIPRENFGKPRSASEGRLELDGGFLNNEAIHCNKHKSNCQIEPMKITLPSYCEATQNFSFSLLVDFPERVQRHFGISYLRKA
jgi:hypothetical protein